MTDNYTYLDLLQKKLDPSQKNVCFRTENTIVAAGAGSGKTQVLASRFAWLVMSKNISAKKILTLTFTKKAAAEMYNRIYSILKFFAENPETPDREKRNAIQAIEDFSEVHIQTLDSYCSNIVKQAANRYGIKPDFIAGSTDSNLKLKALQFVLKYRQNQAIQHFTEAGGIQNFADELGNIINRYTTISDAQDYFTSNLDRQKEIVTSDWNKLMDRMTSIPETLQSYIETAGASAADPYFVKLGNLTDSSCPEFIKISDSSLIETDKNLKEACKKVINWYEALKSIKTTKSKAEFAECKSYIAELQTQIDIIISLYGFISEYNYLKELYRLYDEFAEQIRISKRTSGNLSFADLTELTLKILNEQEDIQLQERNAYDKIMIDEFQDNNGKNRDLLFNLSTMEDGTLNPEKLFFVGDEKQSIYKFRGADVSVFNQLKDDLHTEPVQMVYNYRSTGELLTSFNKMFMADSSEENSEDNSDHSSPSVFNSTPEYGFEAAFPKKAKAKKVNTENYEELADTMLSKKNISSYVCMFNSDLIEASEKNQFLSSEEQQAYFIASKIKELYESENLRYSDFAYLDKSRTNRHHLTKWLSYFGIPYSLDQQGNLFAEAPVNDIYSYLRLCVYPSDTKAFATVLASPFSGLSHKSTDVILGILTDTSREYVFIPFAQAYEEQIVSKLSPKEAQKYITLGQYYTENRKSMLSQSITKTLNQLWFQLSYRYETIQNMNVNLLSEQYDLLFELGRKADEDGKSLAWFVDQLAELRESENSSLSSGNGDLELDIKEVNYPLEKPDAVQIMTIHKSKGLQFKHVFIYGCTGSPKADSRSSFYYSDECGFAKTPAYFENYFFLKNREIEKMKKTAEFKRVLYVAVTRAEKSFYITGSWSNPAKNSNAEPSIMNQLTCFYYQDAQIANPETAGETEYLDGAPFAFIPIKAVSKKEAYSQTSSTQKNDIDFSVYENAKIISYQWPESNRKTPSSLEINQTSEDSDYEQKFEMPSDTLISGNFTAGDFGTLVHAYLEAQANGITPEIFKPDVKLFKNLTEKQIHQVISQCQFFAKSFSQTEKGKELEACKTAKRFYKAEWAFRMFHENTIFTGSIDLIYENPDKTYTIVDYKSDKEVTPEKYTGQQNCYRTAASKLLNIPEEKISCYLWFMREDNTIAVEMNK